ncbi:acyltransferase [Microbacterium sp. SD291]|uniref:acyltransferase family protein n=1 Tax=Microbacterium sp. SD291 TaxID=2782007 RepID=UPI001A9660E4|nr:acyltransferase [Microbacterium sp. SD291]MBO0981019.1 acyltransferase [Microbacterium sp. SD291]
MPRFRELDGLRGVAAGTVLLSHFTGAHNSRYPEDPLPLFDAWWGAFGVQLFFLISGFVILMTAQASARPSDFVASRLSRLYPAYWVSLAIGVLVAWIANVPHVPLEPNVVLANLTMVQRWFLVPNVLDIYWTLAVEMQFYVLLFLLLLATRCRITDKLVIQVATIWLIISLSVAIWAFPASHGIDPQHVATPVKLVLNATLAAYGPLFCAGMLAFISRRNGRLHVLAIPAAAIAVLNTGLLQTWIDAAWIAGICACFLVVAMREHTKLLLIPPLQWLGKISYSLYLTHSIIGYAIIHLLWPYLGRPGAVIVAIVAALAVGWAVHQLAEHRISRWLRNMLTKVSDRRRKKVAPPS